MRSKQFSLCSPLRFQRWLGRKRITTLIFLVFVILPVDAQTSWTGLPSQTAATNVPPGPSIDEIAIWIKRQLPVLGMYHVVTKGPKSTYGTQYAIEYATLNGGHLIICNSAQWDNSDLKNFFTSDVTMKDVDTSKLVPYEAPVSEGYIESKAIFLVPIVALPDRGTPFTFESKGKGNPTRKEGASTTSIALDDMDKAKELADKLRRACILCGAPDLPVTAPAAGPGDQSKPPTSGNASADQPKMTNKDVIKLVAAGLSEQVISNSIRQAPTKDFDLTPTGLIVLKKARVTDAVIVAMQEVNVPSQAAPKPGSRTRGQAMKCEINRRGDLFPCHAPCARAPRGRVFLVKCQQNQEDNNRSVKVGKMGMFSQKSWSTPDGDWTIAFDIKELPNNTWEITPKQDMKPGEYGVLFRGGFFGMLGATQGELFDFGVDK